MIKLSTGQDSTLENWIKLSTIAFGKESEAVQFLQKKADESPNGVKEEVISNESQLIMVLASMQDTSLLAELLTLTKGDETNDDVTHN